LLESGELFLYVGVWSVVVKSCHSYCTAQNVARIYWVRSR